MTQAMIKHSYVKNQNVRQESCPFDVPFEPEVNSLFVVDEKGNSQLYLMLNIQKSISCAYM